MADGKVEIDTSINTSGIEKGAKKAEKEVKGLAKKIEAYSKQFQEDFKNASAPLTELSSAVGIVTGAIGKAIDIVKSYCSAINETAEAYNTQLKAETLLATAAKNNPYLNNESVQNLKNFASSVQEYSVYGDEYLMPFMSQLASSGRTEEEIMDIITTSVDVASSGVMSLESAVRNLNKTYNGTAGELGETNEQIKNLTTEELKAGKAVEVLKNQYSGMAKETAGATGAAQQAANTIGDLKEEIGKITKPSVDAWNNFWKSFATWGISAVGSVKNALDNASRSFGGIYRQVNSGIDTLNTYNSKTGKSNIQGQNTETLEWYKKELTYRKDSGKLDSKGLQVLLDINKELRVRDEVESETLKISQMSTDELNAYYDNAVKKSADYSTKVDELKSKYSDLFDLIDRQSNTTKGSDEYNSLESQISSYSKDGLTADDIISDMATYNRSIEAIQTEAQAAQQKINEPAMNDAQKLKKYYTEVVEAKEKEIEVRKKSGELITAEAEATELAQTKTKAYLEYLNQGGSENQAVLNQIKETYQQIKAIQMTNQATDAKKGYYQTLDVFEKQLDIRKKLGEQISKEEELEERINTKREAYEKMREDSLILNKAETGFNYSISDENSEINLAKVKAEIEALEKELNNIKNDKLNLLKEALSGISEEKDPIEELKDTLKDLETLGGSVKEEIDSLTSKSTLNDEEKQRLDELNKAYDEYADKVGIVRKKLEELENQEANTTSEGLSKAQKILATLSEGINNLSSALSTLSDMWTEQAENEATVATTALEKQFAAGEVSEEEYYEKKEKIEKEAAEKSYKIQMWAWSAQLLQIGASTAQAIMQALSTSGNIYAGIALAATVGVLGAAQMAAAIASKPVPPSYASGGIVGGIGGVSMGQDNTYAHVRTGEAIFNAKQQRELWNIANGQNSSASSGNVTVKNYRGNDTKVSTSFSEDGLQVVIRKIVQEDLAKGTYNQSLMKAENSFDGNMYV